MTPIPSTGTPIDSSTGNIKTDNFNGIATVPIVMNETVKIKITCSNNDRLMPYA